MTVKEYNANLDKFLINIEKLNVPLGKAVQSSVQQIGNRIFDEGKKSDSSDIGQYNTTDPLYVNPKLAPNGGAIKPTKGKGGEHLFKNGKEHKTTYIESYKAYQGLMGKKNDKVYLKNTNSLQSDFRKGNTATKINANKYTIQLDRKENEGKIDGLNEKYGMITDPMSKEVADFERNVNLELNNELEKYGLL